MIMYCGINMYSLKELFWFKRNIFTYLNCDGDCFNSEEFDFRVKPVLGV